MNYRKKILLFFVLIISAILLPAFPSNAENGKKELVYINYKSLFAKGVVVRCGDESGWNDFVETRQNMMGKIGGATEDFSDSAPLVLETFDTSKVALNTPGSYLVHVKVSVSPDFEDQFYISDKNSSFTIPVGIADPDELHLFLIQNSSSHIEYGWYSDNSMLTREIQYLEVPEGVFYSDGELSDADWKICNDEVLAVTTLSSLRILRPLPEDTDYYFRMKVGERISNVVRISNNEEFEYDDDAADGTRDGDDHEEEDTSGLIQSAPSGSGSSANADSDTGTQDTQGSETVPPGQALTEGAAQSSNSPEAPALPSSETSTVDEIVTDTKTTLSGTRIKRLLSESPDSVPFAWDGICLRIPGSYFEDLDLADDSLFSVEMIRTANTTFTLSVELDGEKLTEFAASSVRFMSDHSDKTVSLFLDGEKSDSKVSREDGCYVFNVTRPGTYQLTTGQETSADVQTGRTSHFKILLPALLVVSGGMALYVLWKKKGRRT